MTETLRPVPDASLHVTLSFLGERPEEEVEGLAGAVAAAAGPARDLRLGDAAWLPARRPRVLALALADPSGELRALRSRVAAAVRDAEERPFRPHVTLARVRRGERVRAGTTTAAASAPFDVAAVTLYRSHPGSRYEALASVPARAGREEAADRG